VPAFTRNLLLLLLPAGAALAANSTISSSKPVINFRLPAFTAEGHRAWLVRGSEARYVSPQQIDVKELTLSIFPGKADNEKVETMILSPAARVRPEAAVITGDKTIRVINDQFEATGTDWRYEHKEKKVSITRNVRLTFRAEFKDILK
jgi:lipopolysaccharide export system protein LptC